MGAGGKGVESLELGAMSEMYTDKICAVDFCEGAALASLRAFIEECSRRALEVALHCDDISNLQRGRLLDILLWAGELFLLLRAPSRGFADSILEEHDPVLTRLAARQS